MDEQIGKMSLKVSITVIECNNAYSYQDSYRVASILSSLPGCLGSWHKMLYK